MSHLWGPALEAEVEYRRNKLARVAAAGRRRQRRLRQAPARTTSASGVIRPRAA
jgi:hypothetical protein